MNVNVLIHEIDQRFKSGNAVPVTRASISDREWAQIRAALRALAEIAAGEAERIA